jgi:hypothetical protein
LRFLFFGGRDLQITALRQSLVKIWGLNWPDDRSSTPDNGGQQRGVGRSKGKETFGLQRLFSVCRS